jgi:valyl-tRNA synthetase
MKMSSSRGNIIDPLEVKESYGMDALRFTLAQSSSKGRGMKVAMRDIEASRNFLNKVWNMSRFILLNLDDERPPLPGVVSELEDRFILSRLAATVDDVQENLDAYNFNLAIEVLYAFIWHDFCDWYIELAKVRLNSGEDRAAKGILYHVLKEILKLLHPFVPFISEEIWQTLNEEPKSICIAPFPQTGARDPEAEEDMERFREVVGAVRTIRAELNVPQSARLTVLVKTSSQELTSLITEKTDALNALTNVEAWQMGEDLSAPAGSARQVLADADLFVPLAEWIDIEVERARLRKELIQVEADLEKVEKNLGNAAFLKRAPRAVVEKEESKREEFVAKKKRLQANLAALEG